MKKRNMSWLALVLALLLLVPGCGSGMAGQETKAVSGEEQGQAEEEVFDVSLQKRSAAGESFSIEDIPEFSGDPYVVLNNNEPEFSQADFSEESYETYSELDELGRCGTATANIGQDLMPVEKRGSISQIKPSGWHSVQYEWVDGKSLYNRCHLIGYQLTAENANERNLITGTRFMNTEGMLPFENMVADYIDETDNHVLYRVTPIFEGDNLVASGVQMEAWSVEDEGEGICFNIYAYNKEPGVVIDYKTGESHAEEAEPAARTVEAEDAADAGAAVSGEAKGRSVVSEYILNTNTKKFHRPSCSSADEIKDENRQTYSGDREELISQGYEPCKKCEP